ncbi:MAG: carbohydrate kinase family protein, partial [Anaerotruncus massiliensis (ex Togo et al. 2019)]
RQTLQTVRVLLLSGYLLADAAQARFAVEAAGMTRRAGGLVALDASPNIENVPPDTLREALAVTDILLPNRREMQAITGVWETGAGLDALLCRVPIAALKLGAEGSALGIRGGYSETGRWHVPAVEVTPLDTTGAGDAFNAGFLASYLRGENQRTGFEQNAPRGRSRKRAPCRSTEWKKRCVPESADCTPDIQGIPPADSSDSFLAARPSIHKRMESAIYYNCMERRYSLTFGPDSDKI